MLNESPVSEFPPDCTPADKCVLAGCDSRSAFFPPLRLLDENDVFMQKQFRREKLLTFSFFSLCFQRLINVAVNAFTL